MAGSVIAGVLMASPAAAGGSIPTESLTGVAVMSSVNSADDPTPPPNTTNPNPEAPEAAAEGLSGHDQKIVRAVVNDNGTLVAGQSFGAVSATRVERPVGTYQVCFDVPITNGTYVASIGIPGNTGASDPGEITVVGRFATTKCLFIQTFDSSGVLADRSFHVTVAYSKKR
ncbi:hypothetical protein [Streptomyces sp. NPDC041003]|uniref:hypothetical protein n=1 Tax=Streptomyces sp. NPDC041003 TaxID=3155730 RepID=UPI0033D81B75